MSYEPITDEDIGGTEDALGLGVDRRIRRPVVAVNRYVPTTQSCEGHMKRGVCYPWVEVDEERGNFKGLVRKVGEYNRQNPTSRVAVVHHDRYSASDFRKDERGRTYMVRGARPQRTSRIVPAEMAREEKFPQTEKFNYTDPETGKTEEVERFKSPKVSSRKLGAFRSTMNKLASHLQCQNCGQSAEHRHGQHGCCGGYLCHSLIGVRHDVFGESNESYGFDWSGLGMGDGGFLW